MNSVNNERAVGQGKKKPGKEKADLLDSLGKSLQDVGRNISLGTDRMADVIADESEEGKKARSARLKKEAVAMVTKTVSDIKTNMQGTSLPDFVHDLSKGTDVLRKKMMDIDYTGFLHQTCYEAGRLSRIVNDTLFWPD